MNGGGVRGGGGKGPNMKANLYIGAVAAAGVVVVGMSLRHILGTAIEARHIGWLGLAVLTLLAGRLSVKLPLDGCKVSVADALVFVSAWVFGADFATLTGALDGLSASARRGTAWYKQVFNTASVAISVNVATRLMQALIPADAGSGGLILEPAHILFLTLVLAGTQWIVNTALVSVVVSLTTGVSLSAIWQGSYPWAGAGYLVGSAAAALIFVAVRDLGVGSLVAVVPFPMLLYLGYRARLESRGGDGPAARKAAA